MGIFSKPADKEAYLRQQAAKSARQANKAMEAGNRTEAARLRNVSQKARVAAESERELIEDASK